MTNDQNRTSSDKQKGANIATAGAVGLILGAIGTAAFVLSDQEMRKRATKRLGEMGHSFGKWSDEKVKDLKNASENVKEDLKENLTDMTEKQKTIQKEAQHIKDKAARSIH